MSELGICSRREADELIGQGLVLVNGKIADQLGVKVTRNDHIELRQKAREQLLEKTSVILNKPVGYASHQTDKDYPTALDLVQKRNQHDDHPFSVKIKQGMAPVGRLDIESQGLILLTQDGRVAKAVIGEGREMEKEYLVRYEGEINAEKLSLLTDGKIVLDGRKLKNTKIKKLNKDQLQVILTEGVKRQIRRMFEHVDLKVTGLKRVRIGPIRLSDLPEGKWRYLSDEEILTLLENRLPGRL